MKLELALTREWLETDGLGGYASSTVLACNRRRYHGLLVAPFAGTARRHVFLSRLEEWVHGTAPALASAKAPERGFALSLARYSNHWSPDGHKALASFELAPWPTFVYRIGEATITREVLMARGTPTVLVRWTLSGTAEPLELRLRPLLACREADALTFENIDLDPTVERLGPGGRGLRCKPYEALPAVSLTTSVLRGHFEADPVWYRGVEYRIDIERGFEGHEDLFSPGLLQLPLEPGPRNSIVLAATIGEPVDDPVELFQSTAETRRAVALGAQAPLREKLALGADDFLFQAPTKLGKPGRDGRRTGVIAGFPWFVEWGRDAYISLPGLLLSRGRVEECGDALEGALAFLKGGLLPNVFGLSIADSHYGSVDASLWFARAVRAYDLAGGDRKRIRSRFLPGLSEIARAYAEGTELGVQADQGGLLVAGSPELNPTWMDARTPSGPVTPRDGCAVEINGLWYFLLAYLEQLCSLAGRPDEEREWRKRKRLAGRSFLARFWIEDQRMLADVWKDGQVDASVRPNMVLAAALEFSPLSRARRADVVRRAKLELLTPRGLRTLSPEHPDYVGRYQGGPEERDGAYHQGTVWPWLLGAYVEAALRAFGSKKREVEELRRLLEGFDEALESFGLGHVAEVFDGDPPHRPGGCFAQAWSTAELLRAWQLVEARG